MQDRIIELSDRPSRLRIRNRLLEITDNDERLAAIPISDVAVIIASHPQVTLSQAVLGELSATGGVFIACDSQRLPCGMLLPLCGFHQQVRRFGFQASASVPTRKRCWQHVIRAKILGQASVLKTVHGRDNGLSKLVSLVKSGDSSNVEARAARRYWPALFGAGFLRDRDAFGINQWLNYGYAVLRAIVARAICSAGLHPGLGLHHHHRESGYPLADDLMEPFRPLVDEIVFRLIQGEHENDAAAKTIKFEIVSGLTARFSFAGESRTLFDWSARLAAGLAKQFEGANEKFTVPNF